MSLISSSRLLAVVLLALVSACAHSARPGQGPTPRDGGSTPPAQSGSTRSGAPGAASAAGASAAGGSAAAKKSLAETVKSSSKHEGLFTIYQDTANGSLMLAIPKNKLGSEFIYFTHTVDAPVTAGRFRGAFGTNNVFVIRRHFNRMEFVTQNDRFWFDPGNALSRAADANISPAVIAVQEIVAEDSSAILIKADDIFLTEAFSQIKPSSNPQARPGESFSLGTLSKTKTRATRVRSYPLNTDVTVEYVYESAAPWNRGGSDVTDARNVSIVVQHSLIEMPENDYAPRFDDPRVGYFTQQQTDMVSVSATPYRDLINRWKLVKKNPDAPLSDPVEPITWWIENTTPVEFREVIAEGVLRWNIAFEAAGFTNAMAVQVQPDDADWDAGDIRYNVLRWTSSPNPPFGGYGPSFVNPRTGQILGADIMLEYIYVTNRLRAERAYAVAGMGIEEENAEHLAQLDQSGRFCTYGDQLQLNVMTGHQALLARGATEIELRDYLNQSLRSLILHEVGHTLGLNHNMKASQMLSPEQINNKTMTDRTGMIGSVMDYDLVNLAPKGKQQGGFFSDTPGPYDIWAIQFGYTSPLADPAAEKERMNALLARSTEPVLAFGNDADDMRSPGRGVDPRINTGDLTSDAISYMSERIRTLDDIMSTLQTRYSDPGKSYHELRNAYLILSGQQASAANVISRYVGGVYIDRAFVGQPGGTKPFTAVSRADQKRAMKALESNVFAPGAFSVPAGLYNYLQLQRRGLSFFGQREDPKIHDRVLTAQKNVLNHLMHAGVLTRITDSRMYGNEYPLTEMMSDLTSAIFAADSRGNVNTFRQNLQLEYVNRLTAMITAPTKSSFDYPSQSAALANLRSIQRMLGGKSGVNAETAAHTRHVQFVIEKALKTD